MLGGSMRILPTGPYVELSVRHVPCEGCAEMDGGPPCELCFWHPKLPRRTIRVRDILELAGGHYVNPAFLWGRRWRSLGDTIRVKSVPKWAGGRAAIPPPSFPFLRSSSLPPA